MMESRSEFDAFWAWSIVLRERTRTTSRITTTKMIAAPVQLQRLRASLSIMMKHADVRQEESVSMVKQNGEKECCLRRKSM